MTTYDQIKELNDKIMPLLVDRDEKEYNEAWERVHKCERDYLEIQEAYRELLFAEDREITTDLSERQNEVGLSVLPPPGGRWKLPKFFGDFKKIREWWQQYKVHDHVRSITPIKKFTILKDSLAQGPAAEIQLLELNAQ